MDRINTARSLESLQQTLSEVSLPLLQRGDSALLREQLLEGAQLILPSFAVYESMLPLIVLDDFEGLITPPSLFSFAPGQAEVSARANFLGGVSDIHATVIYSEGQWYIQKYELTRGPLAQ